MRTSSAPEQGPPRLEFAAGSLARGGGGIAELSRQTLCVLLQMRRDGLLDLRVHVLDDAGPAAGDELFAGDLPCIRWHRGRRARFVGALLRARPDCFLFDHVGLARLHGLLPAFLARPYLLLIHSVEIWNNRRADYRRTAARARTLIANSNYTARKAREHYAELPPITVCWPGKDLPPHFEAGTGDAPALGPHAMLIVGRLDAAQRHKGHDQLLEALPLVRRQVPDAQLVVAGAGDDRERLAAKAHALGVTEAVTFTGRLDEKALHRLYDQCALFVMPSDGDGFGLVFLEAMMHCRPCVGLRQGAAAEILEGGACGLLVDRDELPGMAGQLSALLRDAEGRRRLGEAGFARYRAEFTGAAHAARLRNILLTHLAA
jgi:phosphatidylinositol alpha-1,6-mannosyltransferase